MENARKNLVEQISDLIQKYADDYLASKEAEESKVKSSNPLRNILNLSNTDNSEDFYFKSFDEVRDFFSQRKKKNNKIIKLLKELNNGKYDDVFSYYNFQKGLASSQNSAKTDFNIESYISDDYPLIKKRDQREDVEMISDPQMVLNFPTISSLEDNMHVNFDVSKSSSSTQQNHSTEIPIRKLIGQKKRQAPSMKNIINYQNSITGNEEKEMHISNSKSSPNKADSIISQSKEKIINFSQGQPIITQDRIQSENSVSPHRYSQPNIPHKFLDLYPPDPPLIFPSNLNKLNENQVEDTKINSQIEIKEKSNQQIKTPFSPKRNQENKSDSPFRAFKKTTEPKSPKMQRFLSSSSNSSIPTDNIEQESLNPFTSPALDKSRSPFSSASFKPIISSPVRNSFHYLTSTSSSTSENTRRNSSTSAHSSLIVLSPSPSSTPSPTRTTQLSSSLKRNENININEEEDSDEQDSIVELSSNDNSSSSQNQKADDQKELNILNPIITGKDVISNGEKHFLSDEDVEINPNISKQIDEDDNFDQQVESYDTQNIISNDENTIKDSKMQKSTNDFSDSNNKKQIENDSSSEFDESNLSQSLQQSSFIFQDNSSGSQRGMVRSSENPYTKLDAITRLPIKK